MVEKWYRSNSMLAFYNIFTSTGGRDLSNPFYNYLQQLYREVKEILLYQGFPKPILPKKHQERSEGYFLDKVGMVEWVRG